MLTHRNLWFMVHSPNFNQKRKIMENSQQSPVIHIMENDKHIAQQEAQDIFLEAFKISPEKANDVLKLYKDILHTAQKMGGY